MPLLFTCSLGLNAFIQGSEAFDRRTEGGDAEEEKGQRSGGGKGRAKVCIRDLKSPFYTWNKGNCSTCKSEYAIMRKINVNVDVCTV